MADDFVKVYGVAHEHPEHHLLVVEADVEPVVRVSVHQVVHIVHIGKIFPLDCLRNVVMSCCCHLITLYNKNDIT